MQLADQKIHADSVRHDGRYGAWVIINYHPLNRGGQGMVDLEKVSLLPLGGFGKEELLPRGLKYHRAESPPFGV